MCVCLYVGVSRAIREQDLKSASELYNTTDNDEKRFLSLTFLKIRQEIIKI